MTDRTLDSSNAAAPSAESECPTAPASSTPVYLVGLRYEHHARHSGYDGFRAHVGVPLRPPLTSRRMPGAAGKYVDALIEVLTERAKYSLSLLLMEGTALLHMLGRRRSVYHLLNGDRDLWLLGHVRRGRGNRLVATFHTPPSELERLGPSRRLIRNLDAVILVAASQRPFFEDLLPAGRIFVVPHGVDTEFFRPRSRSGTNDAGSDSARRPDLCITVGSHLRDFETFRQAMEVVWQAAPLVRLLAVGTRGFLSSGPDLHRDSRRRSSTAGGRIEHVERVTDEELLRAYHAARVAIFAFRDATANNSVLEAMACGLPIVASDVGGVRDYVGDRAGLLCPPRDPVELARGVLELLMDPTRAARMGAVGRSRAVEYDYRVVACRLEEIYQEIF